MRIAILSRNASLYSTRRLREAGEARGHEMPVIDYLRCYMNITSRRPEIIYQGRPLEDIRAVIPRIGASRTYYGTAVVRQFEMMGVHSASPSEAIARSRDKLRALQLLAREGVGLPVTGFAHSAKDVDGVLDVVGPPPLVIKMLEGTQGVGVVLAETRTAARSVIEAFMSLDANLLVQEFIDESRGSDVRALVIGDEVVAAMRRESREGEFRSNLHRGGSARPVDLTAEEAETAVRAARATGLGVAGVDFLRSDHGPAVLEVNSSPGLQGIEKATGLDVADRIIAHIEGELEHGAGGRSSG